MSPRLEERVRIVANLVNLTTPLGILLARATGCTLRRGPHGLILAEGYRLGFPAAGAFTIGDVVLSRHPWSVLLARHPRLLEHEERHSRQYAVCLGLPFVPLYLLAVGWSWLRTGDPAARNAFERRAGLRAGGYREVPAARRGERAPYSLRCE